MAPDSGRLWQTAGGPVAIDRPLLVGIVNLTPDSFWEGGRFIDTAAALAHAERLLEEGADVLDFGGESTRPGASPVSTADERTRVEPVVRAAAKRWPHVPLSVDTVKADVAEAALDAGAWIINDVSAFRLDARMAELAASRGAGLILMHSRGAVDRMARYELAEYGDDPMAEIIAELGSCLERARSAGVHEQAIVLDPGLGFAKRTEHSVTALAQLPRLSALGRPVLVGPSRKRFVGDLAGQEGLPPDERLEGTIAACVVALFLGARLFRVHDVEPVRRALSVAEAIRKAM
jgi:dihydropteroate synthase